MCERGALLLSVLLPPLSNQISLLCSLIEKPHNNPIANLNFSPPPLALIAGAKSAAALAVAAAVTGAAAAAGATGAPLASLAAAAARGAGQSGRGSSGGGGSSNCSKRSRPKSTATASAATHTRQRLFLSVAGARRGVKGRGVLGRGGGKLGEQHVSAAGLPAASSFYCTVMGLHATDRGKQRPVDNGLGQHSLYP